MPDKQPTPWVSPIVAVPKKDGGVRICVDMRQANAAIKLVRHPIPTVEDISLELNGAKYFSKLDLAQAYHQLELHEDSRYITTFSTHVGLFRYQRSCGDFSVNNTTNNMRTTDAMQNIGTLRLVTVLVRQKRSNKLSTNFNSRPYTVIIKNNSRITVRDSNRHIITRNVSHFKRIPNQQNVETDTDDDDDPIECAFGRLKARWSILTRSIYLKLESIPTVVYSCFVLHNYFEQNKSYIGECTVRKQVQLCMDNEQKYKNVLDPIYSCNAGEGEIIRKILTENIQDNLPHALSG